jgi:hypothetical protein
VSAIRILLTKIVPLFYLAESILNFQEQAVAVICARELLCISGSSQKDAVTCLPYRQSACWPPRATAGR